MRDSQSFVKFSLIRHSKFACHVEVDRLEEEVNTTIYFKCNCPVNRCNIWDVTAWSCKFHAKFAESFGRSSFKSERAPRTERGVKKVFVARSEVG